MNNKLQMNCNFKKRNKIQILELIEKGFIHLFIYFQIFETEIIIIGGFSSSFWKQQIEVEYSCGISLVSIVKMAGSIKFLQFFRQCHQIIGIYPHQPRQKYISTNLTRAIFLISVLTFSITTAAYFVFEATSMFQHGFSFCTLICMILTIVLYSIFIWQSENTLKFLENCEGFIEKSKYWAGILSSFATISTGWMMRIFVLKHL